MSDRHYEIERTMTKPSAGGTVTPTTTGDFSRQSKDNNEDDENLNVEISRISGLRTESKSVLRKRRRTDGTSNKTGIPRKTPRWTGEKKIAERAPDERAPEDVPEEIQRDVMSSESSSDISSLFSGSVDNKAPENIQDSAVKHEKKKFNESQRKMDENVNDKCNFHLEDTKEKMIPMNQSYHENDDNDNCAIKAKPEVKTLAESSNIKEIDKTEIFDESQNEINENDDKKTISTVKCFFDDNNKSNNCIVEAAEPEVVVETLSRKPPIHPDVPRRRVMGLATTNRRDDSARLRKTIQWLEDGARKLREDLAEARAELHEERRASRIARREIEVAVREARANEIAKHQRVIAELKTRLSQSPSRSSTESSSASTKAEFLKDENHRREISAVKKRLAEADATIRKLRSNSLDSVSDSGNGKRRKIEVTSGTELRKLDSEVKALRAANKKLEDKLNMVCTEAEKIRIMELRIQHENHESELNALKKSFRSDAIRMMDEIKNKDREIERLGRLARENRKCRTKDDETMRKLRENENGHQIRLAARIEDKIPQVENEIDLFKREFEEVSEVERLRELAIEQQEFIDVLRQAVKEKERKLDQLSNKKRKEEFYKQWLELEPVAEVDDEEEHEEGDSALSSAPSSLSPQPGGCGAWQTNGVTREAYEAVLLEIDEIQTKYLEEQQELAHAKSQVRDLEKALLQETRGSQNSRRALSEKLRKFEEREAALLAEISELRDQNELLEFRVLELEESPGSRETPDTADSGIVSPEPINIFKQEQNNKQRDRAVATVLPFSSYTHPASPVPVKKPPLSLQESGIFEDDDDDEEEDVEEDEMEAEENHGIELTSCGTQTEAPVGELLQEVQRLQELRERIQERAVKVPANPAAELSEAKIEEDKTHYREKIRELEERLAESEEKEAKRIENDLVVKQREEDLLDENYRLTEKVYWLENELRSVEKERKTLIDVETMTDEKNSSNDVGIMTEIREKLLDAATMTEHEKNTSDVHTMTQISFSSKFIDEECNKIEEINNVVSGEILPISRCEIIYRKALRDNFVDDEALKTSNMEIDGFLGNESLRQSRKKKNIEDCNECLLLRKDYDEKMEKLTKAQCRLVDLEKKEGAFVNTLKQVDVTWSQLENDHAKKLEEIGRRLEEKVECNRRIMERVAQLESMKNRDEKKQIFSCKCNENFFTSDYGSLEISSADVKQRETRNVDFCGVDEADNSMDVDAEERDEETKITPKMTNRESDKTTQTEEFSCLNCKTKRERIYDKKSKSLRRFSANQSPKNVVDLPEVDLSTEIAVEAKEEIDEKSTTLRAEVDGGISRVHLLPEEERPAPEPTENQRLTINETDIDKKVRDSNRGFEKRVGGEGEGWVKKNWKNENISVKGGSGDRDHESDTKICTIFRHGGLHYVIYPEICV